MLHQLDNQCLPIDRVIRIFRHHKGGLGPDIIDRGNLGPHSKGVWYNIGGLIACPLPMVNIISYGNFFIVNRLRHFD